MPTVAMDFDELPGTADDEDGGSLFEVADAGGRAAGRAGGAA